MIRMGQADVIRHSLVKRIIDAFEKEDEKENQQKKEQGDKE